MSLLMKFQAVIFIFCKQNIDTTQINKTKLI